MANDNATLLSPTITRKRPPLWRWKTPQSGGPPPRRGSVPEGLRTPFPRWRNRRLPLWASLRHHGGSEGSVRVEARGWVFEFPYYVAVGDVIAVLNGQPPKGA